ncbi:MAG: hypothetical protein EBU08_18635, partial [Micrococcales bacterium]|nr:hypothetical protein [Micrococcales bacterium]
NLWRADQNGPETHTVASGASAEVREGAAFELQKATADIEPGGWEAWANKQSFGSPSDIVLNARPLAESEPEPEALKPANRLIAAGNRLDSIKDVADEVEYYAVRAHIAETISALAKAQSMTRDEINALSDVPASKSELSPREAAKAAAYILTGGQMTQEMGSYKIKGMPIFQTREDGSTILNPSFAETFFKIVPSIGTYEDIKKAIPAIEARVEGLGMPMTEGSSDEPEKKLLLNTVTKIMRRAGNTLEGKTSAERINSAKLKTTELAKGLSADGISLTYEEGEIGGAPMNASINNDGTLSIRLDPTYFKYQDAQDPELNNRAFHEELLHIGDFAVSIKEAKDAGVSPDQYAAYHAKRRNDLFNKILEVGESDTQVLKALISSISLYDPSTQFDASPAGVGEIRDYLGGNEVKTMQVMSEMLRQLGQIEKRGGLTEGRVELRTAAQGRYATGEVAVGAKIRDLIGQIRQYLMAVYKALSRMRKALSGANPKVGAELDDLLGRIQDVLKGKNVSWDKYGV